MLVYILKRILIFIPTLVAISLMAFFISVNSPADPVEQLSRSASQEGGLDDQSSAEQKVKNEIRKKLGLDLPLFYFSVGTLADVDTLNLIADKSIRNNFKMLCRQYGNPQKVQVYFQELTNFERACKAVGEKSDEHQQMIFSTLSLKESSDAQNIENKFNSIQQQLSKVNNASLSPIFLKLKSTYNEMLQKSSKWKSYVPKIIFHGIQNQYHLWILGDWGFENKRGRKGVLRGDLSNSFSDNQPIAKKITDKFWYSFILVILSIIIAYIVSIPLGIYAAYKKDQKFDRISSVVVFMLYSLPGYFVGTLLLYLFANPDNLVWFPIGGVKDPSVFENDWSFLQKIQHQAPYFVLPLISYTYSSFAFISRMMRSSMVDVLNQDYIRTARAKGMSEYKVVVVHGLRNALLPIITMIANVFPAALGGSVILETIFSIPGLGLEIYNAVMATDIPMIVAVFTLTGLLTVIGYLVADVLYALVDPRINLKSKS